MLFFLNQLVIIVLNAAKIVDSFVKLLVDCMVDAKENIDGNFAASLRNGQQVKLLIVIM